MKELTGAQFDETEQLSEKDQFLQLLRDGYVDQAKILYTKLIDEAPESSEELANEICTIGINYIQKDLLGYLAQLTDEFDFSASEEQKNEVIKVLAGKMGERYDDVEAKYKDFSFCLEKFGIEKDAPEIQSAVYGLISNALSSGQIFLARDLARNHSIVLGEQSPDFVVDEAKKYIEKFVNDKDGHGSLEFSSLFLVSELFHLSIEKEDLQREFDKTVVNISNSIRKGSRQYFSEDFFRLIAADQNFELSPSNNQNLNTLLSKLIKNDQYLDAIKLPQDLRSFIPTNETQEVLVSALKENDGESFEKLLGAIKLFRLPPSKELSDIIIQRMQYFADDSDWTEIGSLFRETAGEFDVSKYIDTKENIYKLQSIVGQLFNGGYVRLAYLLVKKLNFSLDENLRDRAVAIIVSAITEEEDRSDWTDAITVFGIEDNIKIRSAKVTESLNQVEPAQLRDMLVNMDKESISHEIRRELGARVYRLAEQKNTECLNDFLQYLNPEDTNTVGEKIFDAYCSSSLEDNAKETLKLLGRTELDRHYFDKIASHFRVLIKYSKPEEFVKLATSFPLAIEKIMQDKLTHKIVCDAMLKYDAGPLSSLNYLLNNPTMLESLHITIADFKSEPEFLKTLAYHQADILVSSNNSEDDLRAVREFFDLEETEIDRTELMRRTVVKCLREKNFDRFDEIKDKYNFTKEELSANKDIYDAADSLLFEWMIAPDFESVGAFLDRIDFNQGRLKYFVATAASVFFNEEKISEMNEALQFSDLGGEGMYQIVNEGVEYCFKKGNLTRVKKILNENEILPEDVRKDFLRAFNYALSIDLDVALALFEAIDQMPILDGLTEEVEDIVKKEVLGNMSEILSGYASALEKIRKFDFPIDAEIVQSAQECLLRAIDSDHLEWASEINVGFGLKDKSFEKSLEMFGEFVTSDLYLLVDNLMRGDLSNPDFASIGITEKDLPHNRLDKLGKYFQRLKGRFMARDFRPEEITKSDLTANYFIAYTRTKKSTFGAMQADRLIDSVGDFERSNDGVVPLAPEYKRSDVMLINKIDRTEVDSMEISPHVKEKYSLYQECFKGALEKVQSKNVLGAVREFLSQAKKNQDMVLNSLAVKIEKIKMNNEIPGNIKEKNLNSLNKDLQEIKGLDLRDFKNFRENFAVVGKYNQFHDLLREVSFYIALKKNPGWQGNVDGLISSKPDISKLQVMNEFITHITGEETWDKYFLNHKAEKTFDEITNVNAFQDEFRKTKRAKISGKVAMRITPDRGLLMHYSGNIADACWAAKYDNIPKKHPNFTALIFSQNPETPDERLVGATFVIETTAADGTPLLVIRGLNPIENFSNQIEMDSYFENLLDYLRPIAEKQGRKLAIVIDNHQGGSASNRTAVFAYLSELKPKLKQIVLKSSADTDFNDYNIVDDNYLI